MTRATAAFLVGAALAGGNPIAIRYSNRELQPLWGAALRFMLAALLLFAVAAVLRLRLPRGRALAGAVLYGVLCFGTAFSLGYYALDHVHAGLAQTILAIVPLTTLLLAVVQREEAFRSEAVIGAALAIIGIGVLVHAPLAGALPAVAFAALIGNALCVGQATVMVRRFPRVHPVTMNAIGMAVGAAMQIVAAVALGETIALPRREVTLLALVYMIVLGSVVVYILYIVVLSTWSASRAAYSFVVIPLVTVLLSVWLDSEPLTLAATFGGCLIIAGVYVGALHHDRPRRGGDMKETGSRLA